MTKCIETECEEKATHRYKAPDGLRLPLCDKHYKEWRARASSPAKKKYYDLEKFGSYGGLAGVFFMSLGIITGIVRPGGGLGGILVGMLFGAVAGLVGALLGSSIGFLVDVIRARQAK